MPYGSLGHLSAAWTNSGLDVEAVDANLAFVEWATCDQDTAASSSSSTAARAYSTISERSRVKLGATFLNDARAQVGSYGPAAEAAVLRFVQRRAQADGYLPRLDALSSVDDAVDRATASTSTQWLHDYLLRRLENHRSEVIAFSVPFFSQIVPFLAVSVALRASTPGLRIIAGGPTVQLWARHLDNSARSAHSVDAWCLGHGEGVENQVMRGSHRFFGSIRDLDLRTQSLPAFDTHVLPKYMNADRQLPYRTTVGCYWGRCTFCSYGNRYLRAGAFQQIGAETAGAHIAALHDETGVSDFTLADENTSLRLLHRIASATSARRPGIRIRTRARLEPVLTDPKFVDDLVAHGVAQLSVGIETTSQKALDQFDKGLDAATFERALGNCERAGLRVNVSLLSGFVGDAETHAADRDFLEANSHRIGIDTLQIVAVEPGSRLANGREGFGASNPLVNSGSLAFAGGRHGLPLVSQAQRDRSAQLMEAISREVLPDSELARRRDVPQDPGKGFGHSASPRDATVRVEFHEGRFYLADLAWPALAEVPSSVEVEESAEGSRLTATSEEGVSWLRRCGSRSLIRALGDENQGGSSVG